jgi:hypothetical protein
LSFRTVATVLLATRWPKLFSAPWIRVSPQAGFSVAIRTIRVEISCMTPGRPGRVGVNVHFRAISGRCHRRIVSGVTMVATCRKTRRPRRWPFAARRRRWSSVSRRQRPVSCPLRTRFSSIRYSMTVLLVAIDPSGEGHEQHLQAGDIGRHGPTVPCLIPDPVAGSGRPSFRTLRARNLTGGRGIVSWVDTLETWKPTAATPRLSGPRHDQS